MYLVVRPMENCIEEGEFTPRYPHAAENFWYNQKKNQQHNQMSGWRELCSAVAMSQPTSTPRESPAEPVELSISVPQLMLLASGVELSDVRDLAVGSPMRARRSVRGWLTLP